MCQNDIFYKTLDGNALTGDALRRFGDVAHLCAFCFYRVKGV